MADVEQLTAHLESQHAENGAGTASSQGGQQVENDDDTVTISLHVLPQDNATTSAAIARSAGTEDATNGSMMASSMNAANTTQDGTVDDDTVTVSLQVLPQDNATTSAASATSEAPNTTQEGSGDGADGSVLNASISSQGSQQDTPGKKTPSKWAKYKKRYNPKWEKEPGLMEWIRRVPGDNTKVRCRFCDSSHRAHRTELRRHAESVKHRSQSAFVVLPNSVYSGEDTYSQHVLPRMFKCMRVVRVTEWGGSDVLEVFSDVSMPEPENDQVLIKVGAVGVNPVDAYIRSGQFANLPNLPWTPGADCAGTVESCGHLVTRFRPGDRVYTNGSLTGTYAEYTLCSEDSVFGLPDQLDFKGGAAIGIPYFTAYRALMQRARARPGQTVLIHGASGSVGMAAVQFARAYGMTVLGTAGTEDGMRLVREFGAHFVFNHRCEDYLDEILTATEGDGVDVIIEMLANVNLQRDLELLSMGGIVAVVGNRGTIEINPRLLMPKESSIVGVMLQKSTKKERREIATSIRAGIEAGWVRPHIGMEFPLEGASFAHEELMAGNGSQGRIVLVP